MDLLGLGYRPVVGSCEHNNEPSDSIEGSEILDQVSNH
jgi:hypothetical protein